MSDKNTKDVGKGRSFGTLATFALLVVGMIAFGAMFVFGILLLVVALACFAGLLILGLINMEKASGFVLLVISVIMIIALIVVCFASIVEVPVGNDSVITSAPNQSEIGTVLTPGWHIDPYLLLCSKQMVTYNEQVVEFVGNDTASDDYGSISVFSSDNVQMYVDFSVTYDIPLNNVSYIVRTYTDYQDTIVQQICRSVPRDICAQYTMENIIGDDRTVVEQAIEQNITNALDEKGLHVDDFALRDIRPPDDVNQAITDKQVAEQEMVTANYTAQAKVILAEGNKTAAVINAQGSAQSVVIAANATAEAQILTANSSATAIQMISNMLKAQYGDSNVTAYLDYLYTQALTNPNSNISFVIVPTNGTTPIYFSPSTT